MSDIAAIIASLAALIIAINGIYTSRVVKKIDKEVTTMNSQSLSQLADADETRRIDDIPQRDRTPLENAHVEELRKKE